MGGPPAKPRIFCPRCGAGNFDGEAACWRCRTPLPSLASLRQPLVIAPHISVMIKALVCTVAAVGACLGVWYTAGRHTVTPGFPVPQHNTETEAHGPDLIPRTSDQPDSSSTANEAASDSMYNRQRAIVGTSVHTTLPSGQSGVTIPSQPDGGSADTGSGTLRAVKEDPIVAQAQEAIARARLSLGQAGPISSISPTGDIHLKPGATLSRRSQQQQQSSPTPNSPLKTPGVGTGIYLQPDPIEASQ